MKPMNIEKALEHFEWKFKNVWKPSQKDAQAFNSIIDYVTLQSQQNLQKNESLAKLWIEKLIHLNESELYNGERSIQIIDEILDKEVYEWCVILKNKLCLMNFNAVCYTQLSNKKDNALKHPKINSEENKEFVKKHEKELWEALQTEITEENVIKFVENQINRIINKYEK